MPSLSFSQQHKNPLSRHYQGNDFLELAYQCFVDWREAHNYGELHEFVAQIQAINHAAHWLQADIIAHNELRQTFRALNGTILSKYKAMEICRQFDARKRSILGLAANPINDAIIRVHDAQIAGIRKHITVIKDTMRAVKEERYRAPMIEMAYRLLLSGHDLRRPDAADNNATALLPIFWAVEQITCAIYVALEAENAAYLANMCRLSRALAPKLNELIARKEKRRGGDGLFMNDYTERLRQEQRLLERLIEGRAEEVDDLEGRNKHGDEYLRQIVRYWSRWDQDGYAERDFWMSWCFVSKRKCVVWYR